MSCVRHWWGENIHFSDLDFRNHRDVYQAALDMKGFGEICVSCLKKELAYRKRSKEIIQELTKEGRE